jgi:hypothetical protein
VRDYVARLVPSVDFVVAAQACVTPLRA